MILTQVLTIQFVHAFDGTVDGRLEPYWDPDCQCEAVTTFRGRLIGDRLEGTFSTRVGFSGHANGSWVAYRRRVALLPSEEASHHGSQSLRQPAIRSACWMRTCQTDSDGKFPALVAQYFRFPAAGLRSASENQQHLIRNAWHPACR